jgi:hypothetical protein
MIAAVTVFFLGMHKFEGNPYQQTLAEMFCYAIRDTFLRELVEGVRLPAKWILRDTLQRLEPPIPSGLKSAFLSLEAGFDQSVEHVRSFTTKQGVDLADALTSARQLAKLVAQRIRAKANKEEE